ncbi:hypothetical protein CHS0354_041903 [Potamilus streckersoni]|uniref:Fucolectin-related molecule n=1 Tax=Potamilus streckersoni TaxID=2493646 RepID=A0AAE0W1Z3_9BIVA|nr:hypothetical protein CHS0354_041903 [Potamilus streckersoni]
MLCWWCPFFLIFFDALLWDLTEAVCDPNSNGYKLFGPECEYLCHCINNSQCDDSTGECIMGCNPGWIGPGCQYVDIAYGAYVVMKTDPSMLTPMNLLQDGDKLKCNIYSSLGSPSISFTFSGPVEISIIQIYYDASKLFSPYKLYIKKGSEPAKLCYEKINATSKSTSEFFVKVESIQCSQPMIGDYIEMFNNGSHVEFPLCEIDIPIGRNVAFGRAVFQSSNEALDYAFNAVDGNVEGEANQQSCSQTSAEGTSNPWWYVDLQTTWRLKNVLVYSPGADGSSYRTMMARFQVSASRSSSQYYMTLLYDNGGKPVQYITYISGLPGTDFQYIKIIIPGDNQILSLCEVQVLSDCPEKSCGLQCNIPCNCKSYNFFGLLSGICNGCEAGWTGSHANMCDIPCSSGYYGENCATSCGHCAGSIDCDIYTGNCLDGCETGWEGPNCNRSCPWGFYGSDCSFNCSGHCLGNVTCELASGVCPRGACEPGYFTATCSQSCLWGSYGTDCVSKCSGHCRGNVTCNIVTGECPGGLCMAGFQTAACSKLCSLGYYGENCITPCGHCYEHDACDRYTGDCPGSCDSGYKGQKCDIEKPFFLICNTNCLSKRNPHDVIGYSIISRDLFAAAVYYGWELFSCATSDPESCTQDRKLCCNHGPEEIQRMFTYSNLSEGMYYLLNVRGKCSAVLN